MESPHNKINKENVSKAEHLSRKTHFSTTEVLSLLCMYRGLTSIGKMDRLRFREVMHSTFDITDDVMLDRTFRAFDHNNDSVVDDREWVLGLSILLRGTLEEQINFCYFVYDINGDKALAREELYHCLKNCLIRTAGIEEDIEESIKDIVEMAMKKLDVDKNGQITFSDYHAAVMGDPLLLEACGPCLPPARAASDFLSTFVTKYPVTWKSVNQKRKPTDSEKGPSRIMSSVHPIGTTISGLSRLSMSPPRKLQFSPK